MGSWSSRTNFTALDKVSLPQFFGVRSSDARHQPKAGQGEGEIGSPTGEPGRQSAAGAQRQAQLLQDVISKKNQNAARDAHNHVSSSSGGAKRSRDQHHHQTGPGRRQSAMELGIEGRGLGWMRMQVQIGQ